MRKVAKLRSGWCNPSESYVSYSWILEEAARVFVTSLVYAVLNWQVLDMASGGASGTVTDEDQRSYIKIETLRSKTLQKLLLLTKRGLETLNRSWNCSQTSGEVHPPHDPKNFDECNQRSSKWWSLLMIRIIMTEFHVEQVWPQHIIVTGCKNCTEKCTKTDLTCSGIGHSFSRQRTSAPGEVVTDLLSKYEWEVLPHAPYSPYMNPPDFDIFPKLKEPTRGFRFSSLEEVSAAVTQPSEDWTKVAP